MEKREAIIFFDMLYDLRDRVKADLESYGWFTVLNENKKYNYIMISEIEDEDLRNRILKLKKFVSDTERVSKHWNFYNKIRSIEFSNYTYEDYKNDLEYYNSLPDERIKKWCKSIINSFDQCYQIYARLPA